MDVFIQKFACGFGGHEFPTHPFVGSDQGVRVHVCHPGNVAMAMENPPEFVDHV